METAPDEVRVVEVPVELTYDLRRRVLRDHRPDLPVANPEDDGADAFHLAAVDHAGTVIGVASFGPQPCPERREALALRLRGMAVEPDRRGTGVGSRLVVRRDRHPAHAHRPAVAGPVVESPHG